MKKTIVYICFVFLLAILAGFLLFLQQINYSRGPVKKIKTVAIVKGDSNIIIGEKLEREGIIKSKYYFYYYMWSRKLASKILPGEYDLSGLMTISEIALTVTQKKENNIKITFPEGWTLKQMSERLKANGLSGDEFFALASNPAELKKQYDFLSDTKITTLEGYLFPETYFFIKEMDPSAIIKKMLETFNIKITSQMKSDIAKNNLTLHDIIIMASIIEGEVRTEDDRKTVSGIFWNRIRNGQALQSCATLAYVTGEKKRQYSEDDTKIQSPFNTYLTLGLPPAPISNPGLSAIEAAIYPNNTDYNYFLNDPESGRTIFSKTYEEHLTNKEKYGL